MITIRNKEELKELFNYLDTRSCILYCKDIKFELIIPEEMMKENDFKQLRGFYNLRIDHFIKSLQEMKIE